ncbi:protein/nucleic acid deglycase DJ-1 [Cryptotermes secundus]|uniref:protein/nucleic acid deglycase DJ-1 n=1 Tax=Cryptotermes secundus TaxID=105785 RepID=UPI000CD7CD4C|nr:protein/nucleic acid deglycase DJ-1 [Cryptotermes secundus]
MGTKSALVIIAEGAEEMEVVISVDVLRRAGISVTVAGLAGPDPVRCSRSVVVCPDSSLQDALTKAPFDAIVLPGGLGGARNLAASSEVGLLLQQQEKDGRLVAAICAAPTALQAHNVGFGKSLTSYPSLKEQLQEKYAYKEDSVVVDGNLVTSRGPGTAFDFALAIVDTLLGPGASDPVAKAMLKV